MAIAFTKYVDITSGVGGGAAVRLRDLIGRLFTTNPLLPTGSLIEFDTIEEVGEYFGTSSDEYLRAQFYFSWVSKSITQPNRIGFARWADVATAPLIYGNTDAKLLATLNAVTAGGFTLTIGGTAHVFTALDLSLAASFADVAAALQTKIRTGTGTMVTSATVTYDAVRGSFNFTGGDVGAAAISVTDGAQTPLAAIGWTTGAILSDGADAETVTETLTASADASNNFGSFLFMPTLSLDETEQAAAWNASQNVLYQFCSPVVAANTATWSAALIGKAGTSLTLAPLATEYPEMVPMMILAATRYERRNAVQNYMFQQFDLSPSVIDTTESNTLDQLRVNYYGRTQTAGQFLDFYQRGVMMGGATAPVDMNVYANEQWLKDAAAAAIMSLLLSLPKVSANTQGRSQLLTTLQSVIDRALFNGTISVGKPLNNTQKIYIENVTGDPDAWYQVQTIGYWLDVIMESYVTQDGRTEWKAVYTLVYSKDDTIRKVDGTHILI
jgi:hypothetical protein